MKAIIQDQLGRYVETLKGTYREGAIWYKRTIWSTPKDLSCDLSKLVDLDKTHKVAVYSFDGKDYKQKTFIEGGKSASIEDYATYYKLGIYARDSQLKKPFDVKAMLEFLMFAIMLMTALLNFFVGQQSYKMIQEGATPINKTVQQNAYLISLEHNNTIMLYRLFNETYRYMQLHNP